MKKNESIQQPTFLSLINLSSCPLKSIIHINNLITITDNYSFTSIVIPTDGKLISSTAQSLRPTVSSILSTTKGILKTPLRIRGFSCDSRFLMIRGFSHGSRKKWIES